MKKLRPLKCWMGDIGRYLRHNEGDTAIEHPTYVIVGKTLVYWLNPLQGR